MEPSVVEPALSQLRARLDPQVAETRAMRVRRERLAQDAEAGVGDHLGELLPKFSKSMETRALGSLSSRQHVLEAGPIPVPPDGSKPCP